MSIKITNELLKRYANNQCTAEEKIYVELWYNKYAQSQQAKQPDLEKLDAISQRIWTGINQGINRRPHSSFTFLKVAAAIIVLASISFAIFQFNNEADENNTNAKINFVSGQVKAQVLVASNSSTVYSNSDVKKIMSELHGDEEMSISTQIGEEYHAILPDGSEIWLNANSELIIPANFNENYRDLKLQKGEAYFKVAKDKTKPFRVFAARTKIEALGTEFNVNYYNENKGVKAFLIEGSISVSKKDEQSVIKPNQLYEGDDLTGTSSVSEIENPEAQYAWKSGYFEYANTPLPVILEELSRWYNFSFEINPIYKNKTLTGKIARKQPFSEVLAILEFSGIKYRKEGGHLALIP